MLPRVRSAVLRSSGARSAGRPPADRLTELLVPVGGWLPPEPDDEPDTRRSAQVASASVGEPAGEPVDGRAEPWARGVAEGGSGEHGPEDRGEASTGQWPDLWRDEPAQEPAHAPPADLHEHGQRSWAPAGRHASFRPARWWRLELGRSAVGALLIVAALAALVAAAVVLWGRPQEVVAPVIESRSAVGSDVDDHHAGEGTAGGGGAPAIDATGVPLPPDKGAAPASGTHVVVAVAGKVRTPGLVRLPAGSRVDDAVKAAGGPVDPSAVGLLNLARVLVDGEQVLVGVEPPPGSPPAGGAPGAPPGAAAGGGLLDLNAATASDLDGLPGIGPVLAQRIVDWRTENGRFASVDQLREVTGIGEAKYQELVAKVVV